MWHVKSTDHSKSGCNTFSFRLSMLVKSIGVKKSSGRLASD